MDVQLQVDLAGSVWWRDAVGTVRDSSVSPKDFLASADFVLLSGQLPSIRLMGTVVNADLIVRLEESRQQKRWSGQVVLVNPACCRLEDGPLAMLRGLAQFDPISSGRSSCHELNSDDRDSYALLRHGCAKPALPLLLHEHPAWPALSFLPTLVPEVACQLLAEIVDPRWFFHSSRPDRLSRVHAYLGLTDRNFKAPFDLLVQPGHHYDRAMLCLGSWYGQGAEVLVPDAPGNFLWRILQTAGSRPKGLLKASAQLVNLVVRFWLAKLQGQEELFSPEMFFKHGYEARAFQKHRQDCQITLA